MCRVFGRKYEAMVTKFMFIYILQSAIQFSLYNKMVSDVILTISRDGLPYCRSSYSVSERGISRISVCKSHDVDGFIVK